MTTITYAWMHRTVTLADTSGHPILTIDGAIYGPADTVFTSADQTNMFGTARGQAYTGEDAARYANVISRDNAADFPDAYVGERMPADHPVSAMVRAYCQ